MVETDGSRVTAVAERELNQQFGMELFRNDSSGLSTVEDAVRGLLETGSVQPRKTGAVIDSSMVQIKKVPVPLGIDQDMAGRHLRWEAEQFLISPLDEYIIEHQRTPFQTREGNPVYLLICIRRSIISKIHRIMKNAGLVLADVDVDVFSQLRFLTQSTVLDESRPYLFLNLDSSSAHMVLIRNNDYFLSQVLQFRDGTEESEYDSAAIFEAVEKELKRIMFGHDMGQGIQDLGGIFLAGGQAAGHMAAHLEEVSDTAAELVNPFKHLALADGVQNTASADRFLAAAGAVIKRFPALVTHAS